LYPVPHGVLDGACPGIRLTQERKEPKRGGERCLSNVIGLLSRRVRGGGW